MLYVEGEKIIFEVLIRVLSLSKDKILKLKDDEVIVKPYPPYLHANYFPAT